MKWVALVIAVCLVAYTFLTLHYRKTAPSYRPYQDTKDRAGVMRLLSAGFQRVVLPAQRPADPATRADGVNAAPSPAASHPTSARR